MSRKHWKTLKANFGCSNSFEGKLLKAAIFADDLKDVAVLRKWLMRCSPNEFGYQAGSSFNQSPGRLRLIHFGIGKGPRRLCKLL
jgi:hypothetical protein